MNRIQHLRGWRWAALGSVIALAACGTASDDPPLSVGGGSGGEASTADGPAIVTVDPSGPATAEDLVTSSYVVARGRFVGLPEVVEETAEVDPPTSDALLVWRFVPEEVFRDVRRNDDPSVVAQREQGEILVAMLASRVADVRGERSFEQYVRENVNPYNLNSYPADTDLYVFLRPGVMSDEVVERRPDLASVMVVTGRFGCVTVDALDRTCVYASDEPGGPVQGVVEAGELLPEDFTEETVRSSGQAAAVQAVLPDGSPDPSVDQSRFEILLTQGEG